ncbi:hypothetical protein [Mycolicibacterium mengxianglii]|uniref:hypothetical protein n=1 Tax=Mycolicibacterium mengxianglii TaxID=2736649 RepID=UPI0018D1364B|nr:hypothetical protein [Mycolicibacterium mengxianglii]
MTEQWDNFEKPEDKSKPEREDRSRDDGAFGQREAERRDIEERRRQQRGPDKQK